MTRRLTPVAFAALLIGTAAPAFAQTLTPASQPRPLGTIVETRSSGGPVFVSDSAVSYGHGAWATDHDADALNQGIAERNDAAADFNAVHSYGASGVAPYPPPPYTTTTTTTTTTSSFGSSTYRAPGAR